MQVLLLNIFNDKILSKKKFKRISLYFCLRKNIALKFGITPFSFFKTVSISIQNTNFKQQLPSKVSMYACVCDKF